MKTGLIITTFNRPGYLKQCLESVSRADLSQINTVLIVDDCSADPETRRLIDDFDLDDIELIKCYSKENRSIKGSLLFGYDVLFNTCDVVINLDADAIVRVDFIKVLLALKQQFPDNIVCGFNTTVKNRNPIIEEFDNYFKKKYASGINMVINKIQYDSYTRPALVMCLEKGGNWDFETSKLHEKDGKAVIVSKPSVIQHIGVEISSMGHISKSEPPDVATDFISNEDLWMFEKAFYKLDLRNVTLIGADCVDIDRLIRAANKSCEEIKFGDVKLLSSFHSIDSRVVPIRHLAVKGDYSDFMMKELYNFIDTDFILVIQHDGYVLNPSAWDNEWLNYDYIGAPFEWYTDGMNVGNGGFSLRSKKLHKILHDDPDIVPINEPGVTIHKEEDHCICRLYRKLLENRYGIKFAPIEVARKFSIEGWRSENRTWTNEFGFHGSLLTNIKP